MSTFPSTALAGALAATLTACAQAPASPGGPDHAAHHPAGASAPAATPADRMAMMDTHMKARYAWQQEELARGQNSAWLSASSAFQAAAVDDAHVLCVYRPHFL